MSAQNPPSGQPTSPTGEPTEPTQPVEGAGPTSSEGAATPPPPPPPGDTTTFDQAPPPPPPSSKSSRTPLIIGIAVLLVLLLVGGAVAVILNVTGEDKHSISIPSSAGGMKRDQDKENELKQQLDAAEQQFKTQAKNVSYVKSGVYNQADKAKGPEGALVFLGAKLDKIQSPTKFVESFSKQAGSNGFKIDKIEAGDGGGRAVCASQDQGQKVAICAWATRDSMGELIPTVPGWEADKLASIMRELRADVEQAE
jgi:hypothetical protein